jgi:hypothetical protein
VSPVPPDAAARPERNRLSTLAPGRPGYPDDAFSVLAASRFVNIISYAEIGKQEIVPNLGLTHNLGGFPHQNVCSVSIVGQYEA